MNNRFRRSPQATRANHGARPDAISLEFAATFALVAIFMATYGYLVWHQKIPLIKRLGRFRTPFGVAKHLDPSIPFYSTSAAYSAQRAVNSFAHFGVLSQADIDVKTHSFAKLRGPHRVLGKAIGYTQKLAALQNATKTNAQFTGAMASFASKEYWVLPQVYDTREVDLNRARESLKHIVRDWSDDGKGERERTITPILDRIESIYLPSKRTRTRALVPGCGLGRLAWEIAQMGLDVTAVEYSHFMALPTRFLFSPEATTSTNQHTVHPFSFNLSHQRSTSSLIRPVTFPDVIPRFSPTFKLLEADFLALYVSETSPQFDLVVTLFFIDTAINIIDYLQQIYDLLVPGGVWINLGPLLWTPGSASRMELSLEEVIALAELIGFTVDPESRQRVDTEYTSNAEGMMRWIYEAEMWTARKPT